MKETVTDKTLTLELADEGAEVVVRWLGRSTAREPRTFLQPVLQRMLDASLAQGKPLVLDFRELEYLNSSTITPVVRLLQAVKVQAGRVVVRYRDDLQWQRLSFSALKVLQGDGKSVVIDGGSA
jgi:hypothetical protein